MYYVKIVLALIVFCAVLSLTQSEKNHDGRQGYYAKVKRGKYGPPKYGRPLSYSSPHSYGPPNDNAYSRKPKVSKRPTNHGSGDDDINNIIKHLSKEDLDKLIEFAGEKNNEKSKIPIEKDVEYRSPPKDDFKVSFSAFEDPNPNKYSSFIDDEGQIFKDFVADINSHADNYNSVYQEPKPFSLENSNSDNYKNTQNSFEYIDEYIRPPKEDFKIVYSNFEDLEPSKSTVPVQEEENKISNHWIEETDVTHKFNTVFEDSNLFSLDNSKPSHLSFNYATQPTPLRAFAPTQNNIYETSIAALQNEESMLKRQIEYLQSQIKNGVVYTDSNMMPEEKLPKPMNLRDEHDADASFTNNVPTYVKAEQSNFYKLENFGNLPLMDYNSKRDSLSSYHVPHYTVTDLYKPPASSYSALSSYSAPSPSYGSKPYKVPVEAAPPVSDAKYQSDAHLKAVKIWSHKSKGTAYTLHHDGTLSLEKPSYGYGH